VGIRRINTYVRASLRRFPHEFVPGSVHFVGLCPRMSDQLPATHIAGTLASYGVEVDEIDKAVIGAAWEQFGPGMIALLGADLSGVAPEPDFDPSGPPRDG
jgi:hypothetical protein